MSRAQNVICSVNTLLPDLPLCLKFSVRQFFVLTFLDFPRQTLVTNKVDLNWKTCSFTDFYNMTYKMSLRYTLKNGQFLLLDDFFKCIFS